MQACARLGLSEHAHGLRGGLPVRAEAAQHADGLRHEAHMPHDGHARPHNRTCGRHPRSAAPCICAAACHCLGTVVNQRQHCLAFCPCGAQSLRALACGVEEDGPLSVTHIFCRLRSMFFHGQKDSLPSCINLVLRFLS